jgi:acyl carrier protein
VNQTDIRSAVKDVLHRIAPEAELSALSGNADLRESLDIDSFDFLNVLVALHERFGVDIPESDYGRVRTLDGLAAYLAAKC